MTDTYSSTAIIVEISASVGQTVLLTDYYTDITMGLSTYSSFNQNSLDIERDEIVATLDKDRCMISNLPDTLPVIEGLAVALPYSRVTVSVKEVEVDELLEATVINYIFDGLVYQSIPEPTSNFVSLDCRGRKYYTDITAGAVCTEQCAAVFGDKICQTFVASQEFTIIDITGNNITIQETPTEADFTYNKGYIEKDGVRIKIKYWGSGSVFQLAKPAPSFWINTTATFVAGCDKQLSTCRAVHNNEANFWGLGYSMVDYNGQYEQP